jgi:hypothetical protein
MDQPCIGDRVAPKGQFLEFRKCLQVLQAGICNAQFIEAQLFQILETG